MNMEEFRKGLESEARKENEKLKKQFRDICYEQFKDCDTEQDLDERYEELRQNIVCEMSDRAEELGIDPDTL